ncbi:MAG: T9SS type A sorting domain-containing protein [Candidatus Coatesbacteria bacterium]|nr:MAG: T9SS type A sorting domain-containing protein [Candidatus Coatesbacteria bacterium]
MVIITVVLLIFYVSSFSDETAVGLAVPQYDTWTQTDWSGEYGGEYLVVSNPDIKYNDYYDAYATLTPFGEISVGLYSQNIQIRQGVTGVRDLVFAPTGHLIAAADMRVGDDTAGRVLFVWVESWAEEWQLAPGFPPNAYGDTPIRVNSLEVTYDAYVFAGVTMRGGYAGVYRSLLTEEGITQPWEYLGGPGNPQDNPPTAKCTDVLSVYGLSDGLLVATGDSGRLFYYDGNDFTPIVLPDTETVHGLYRIEPYFVKALTGPEGLQYFSHVSYPFDWSVEEWGALDSADLYDSVSFGNYNYIGAGGPARVYRQAGLSDPVATGDLRGDPEAVYCLGHVGNLILAGTGPSGILYGTRDNGNSWAVVSKIGEQTAILGIDDLGSYVPWLAFGCAAGDAGGFYFFAAPEFAYLESSALDVGAEDSTFGVITWDANDNGGIVEVYVRTFDAFDEDNNPIAPTWEEIPPVPFSGFKMENMDEYMEGIVNRGDKYLQYGIFLGSSPTGESPVFEEIRLNYGSLGYESLLTEDEVYAYPNPVTNDICELHYALSEDADVTAEVYDLKGRLVWSAKAHGTALQPRERFEWDTSNIAPDVYFFRISARTADGDADAVVKKLAVLK